MLELPKKGLRGRERKEAMAEFANQLKVRAELIEIKLSARGWGYELEGDLLITKDQFDWVENLVNECRRTKLLPIDFCAEEEARQFSGIETPDRDTPEEFIEMYLESVLEAERYYTPDWWDGEDYYIQMVVEKIDLVSLFKPICQEYHIPIASAKGWSSMLMRAKYARRFKRAEENGLIAVLLYCGDHDPDGLRISDFLLDNLYSLRNIYWEDGEEGYDPSNLIIDRFGLNRDFIEDNDLTWIDNLHTGAKKPCPVCKKPKRLDDPHHKNHKMKYVQDYLKTIGVRKCEANALVKRRDAGRNLCRQAIEEYVGPGALGRFQSKSQAIKDRLDKFRNKTGITDAVNEALEMIDEFGEDED